MERDHQVELIRKYYRGQLSESEQVAFNQLKEDPAFQEELIQFTLLHDLLKVQSLQQEATAILSRLETASPQIGAGESKEEDVFPILRLGWEDGEQQQEQDGEGNFTAIQAPTRPTENQERLNGRTAKLGDENVSRDIPGQERTQEKRRSIWNWLAAAVTISVICLGGLWWYGQNRKEEIKVSILQTPADTLKVAGNQAGKLIDTPKSETDSLNDNPPAPASRDLAVIKRPISKAERQRLVKSNFVADSLPSEITEDLEVPAALYKNQQHQEAIVEYKKVLENLATPDPELASRGQEDSNLTAFLAYYYLGQSYLSLSQTTKTIAALKRARKQAPNPYWKSKTEWYLALAYLQTGKVQEARKLLQLVAGNQDAGAYRQKARQLNNKLKKL